MQDINSVNIIGRLTNDAQLKWTSGNNPLAIAYFSIATSRRRGGGEEETYFFDCSIVGKLAENLAQYLTKGQQVAIKGFLRFGKWNGKDGSVKTKVDIGVEEIELLAKPKNQNQQGGNYEDDNYNCTGSNYAGSYDVGINY